MKRFYRLASAQSVSEGHRVLLDGRPVRTPAKTVLSLPNAALAEAIAAEWQAQGEELDLLAMPLTRLAATALDRVDATRPQVVQEVAAYAGTDLLCYRAEHPPELRARQDAAWQPSLEWLRRRYDVHLQVTGGILAVPQSRETIARLETVVAALDVFRLAGLHALTTGLGSLVLSLQVLEGELEPEAAFAASQIDELFQEERWGVDREASLRREGLRRDMLEAARFLALLRD